MALIFFVLWVGVTNATSLDNKSLSLSHASFSKNTTSSTLSQLMSSTARIQTSYTYPYDAISHRSRLVLDCSSCVFLRLLHRRAVLLISNVEQCRARKVQICLHQPQYYDSHSKNSGVDAIRVMSLTDLDWARILK